MKSTLTMYEEAEIFRKPTTSRNTRPIIIKSLTTKTRLKYGPTHPTWYSCRIPRMIHEVAARRYTERLWSRGMANMSGERRKNFNRTALGLGVERESPTMRSDAKAKH